VLIGAYYPQTEIGVDRQTAARFARSVELIGYDYLVLYDHVLAADHGGRADLAGRYTLGDPIGEVFVLLAYLAAHTERIGLVTGVLVLPQRQTVLVAKQAAIVDLLSDGRLRLGVGLGWSPMDYQALGMPWDGRAARLEEQVHTLRALWTQPEVHVHSAWHDIDGALHPLPVQQPIPVWFGGAAEPMLRRGARLGDGFMMLTGADEEGRQTLDRLRGLAEAEGRADGSYGIEGRLHLGGSSRSLRRPPKTAGELAAEATWWAEHRASHLTVNTRWAGLAGTDEHVQALTGLHDVVRSAITGPVRSRCL
jgi:probable F420-dependent oxidoreductase